MVIFDVMVIWMDDLVLGEGGVFEDNDICVGSLNVKEIVLFLFKFV